eukprot:g13452.t1
MCFFGYHVAVYLDAWISLSLNREGEEARGLALMLLRQVNKLTMMDQVDFLVEFGAPITTWDILVNIWRLEHGKSFYEQGARSDASDRDGASCLIRRALFPEFASPHVQLPVIGLLPSRASSPTGSTASNAMKVERFKPTKPEVSALYLSSHFGALYDAIFVIERHFPNWQLHKHGVLSYHKKYFPEYQSDDEELVTVLSQIHETKEAIHESFDTELQPWFDDWFERKFAGRVSLVLCGHPVIWCKLFSGKEGIAVVASYNQPYMFLVPKKHEPIWRKELSDLVRKPNYFFVGYTAYHAIQLHYVSDVGVIPWQKPMALRLGDMLRKTSNSKTERTLDHSSEVQELVEDASSSSAASTLALEARENPYVRGRLSRSVKNTERDEDEDPPSKMESKSNSGIYNFSKNESKLKILEFDSTGGVFHGPSIALRKLLEPYATVSCAAFGVPCAEDPDWTEFFNLNHATTIPHEDPVLEPRSQMKQNETAGDRPPTNQDINVFSYEDEELVRNSDTTTSPAFQRLQKMELQAAFYDFALLWPYDVTNAKLAEYYALRVPIFTHRELWRYTRRGSHALFPGGEDPRPDVVAELEKRVAGELDSQLDVEEVLERGAVLDLELSAMDVLTSSTAGREDGDEMEKKFPYAFTPFEWQGRFQMDPYGAWFYSRISEFALRPHLQYYDSLSHLLLITKSIGRDELLEISRKMNAWYVDGEANALRFWKKLFRKTRTVQQLRLLEEPTEQADYKPVIPYHQLPSSFYNRGPAPPAPTTPTAGSEQQTESQWMVDPATGAHVCIQKTTTTTWSGPWAQMQKHEPVVPAARPQLPTGRKEQFADPTTHRDRGSTPTPIRPLPPTADASGEVDLGKSLLGLQLDRDGNKKMFLDHSSERFETDPVDSHSEASSTTRGTFRSAKSASLVVDHIVVEKTSGSDQQKDTDEAAAPSSSNTNEPAPEMSPELQPVSGLLDAVTLGLEAMHLDEMGTTKSKKEQLDHLQLDHSAAGDQKSKAKAQTPKGAAQTATPKSAVDTAKTSKAKASTRRDLDLDDEEFLDSLLAGSDHPHGPRCRGVMDRLSAAREDAEQSRKKIGASVLPTSAEGKYHKQLAKRHLERFELSLLQRLKFFEEFCHEDSDLSQIRSILNDKILSSFGPSDTADLLFWKLLFSEIADEVFFATDSMDQ